jgi:hypothetical protein
MRHASPDAMSGRSGRGGIVPFSGLNEGPPGWPIVTGPVRMGTSPDRVGLEAGCANNIGVRRPGTT